MRQSIYRIVGMIKSDVKIKYLLLLCCCNCFSSQVRNSREIFPITGYSCEYIHQANSCGINVVQMPSSTRYAWFDSVINLANRLDMRIILSDAVGRGIPPARNLTKISGSSYIVREAESKLSCLCNSRIVIDTMASGNKSVLLAPSSNNIAHVSLYVDSLSPLVSREKMYYAAIKMKANRQLSQDTSCKIVIHGPAGDDWRTETSETDMITALSKIGEYEWFSLTFKINEASVWFEFSTEHMGDGDSLFLDCIEIRDAVADSLARGIYDSDIRKTAEFYKKQDGIFRYYLWDEPGPHQFYASKKVNDILKEVDKDKTGIQAISHYDFFKPYLDVAGIREMLIDYYPFWGQGNGWGGRIPKDSGQVFQRRLSYLCDTILNKARLTVKDRPGTKFWFVVQSFGQVISGPDQKWNQTWNDSISENEEGWWREPTPRELKCITWLALAYGCKGICYWRYHSRRDLFHGKKYWIVGMTDSLGGYIRRPLWYAVRDMNIGIEKAGDILLDLNNNMVFPADNIPDESFIRKVSDPLLQIGIFTDKQDDYFIVVNRHCLTVDTVTTKITLYGRNDDRVMLYDCIADEKIIGRKLPTEKPRLQEFELRLLPGEGKLYKLVH